MKTFKSLILVVVTVLSFTVSNAQEEPAITHTKWVEASADDVWDVLRQMDDIQKYSSLIEKVKWTGAHGVGGERTCYSPDENQGYYKERIIEFNDDQRSYTYQVVEGVPAAGMVNMFKVVDLGYKSSLIVWTSNYEQFMENPQMTEEQFIGFLNNAITEMTDKVALASN